jgi:catechol 2,3-dioxygenase-like lactoylglutathione lyase family enzyme
MSTVQQIVYTDHPEQWHRLAEGLGLTPAFPPTNEWSEFDGDGVLAVHRAYSQRPAGACDITILVADLDVAGEQLQGFHVVAEDMQDVGRALRVTTGEGSTLVLIEGRRAPATGLVIEPLWFQTNLDEPRAILAALGFRAEIVGTGGGWAQMKAPGGGSIGLHGGRARIEASFREQGDLDTLATKSEQAGFAAAIIDEAYARTLRIQDPDGGQEVWVNGRQDDLYGYSDQSA